MELKRFFLMLGVAAPLAMVAACDNDGPMEEAGEDIDEAVEELDNDGAMEEAGEEIDNAVDDMNN